MLISSMLAPGLQQTQLSQNIPSGTGTLQSAGPQQSKLVMPVFPLRPPAAVGDVALFAVLPVQVPYRQAVPAPVLVEVSQHRADTARPVSSMKPNMDSSNCILVQDVKDVTNDQITMGSESTQLPTEALNSTSADSKVFTASTPNLDTFRCRFATDEHGGALERHPQHSRCSSRRSSAASRRRRRTGRRCRCSSSASWTPCTPSPFRRTSSGTRVPEQAAGVHCFNFTLPWGANFAVSVRNVAPSVTQYDFVEFVKGGRVDHRLRRKGTSEME
ncbi:hypothetical protein NQ318_008509, partial [Aromia moschata]